MTLLKRNGNKSRISHEIQKLFPPHKIYIEMFFGAGGMFFNKPIAKYNILNDVDDDIFNLFMVIKNQREELIAAIEQMPVHMSLMKYWKRNPEADPIWKACRFLFISNFTYLSKGYNLKFTADNSKSLIIDRIQPTFEAIQNAKFMCLDFREVLKHISFSDDFGLCRKTDSFIYNDPPYLGTNGWYTSNSNSEQDFIDHLDLLLNSGIRFAMSEFDNPLVIDLSNRFGLFVHTIGERRNLKNRRTEILITNYKTDNNLFSDEYSN